MIGDLLFFLPVLQSAFDLLVQILRDDQGVIQKLFSLDAVSVGGRLVLETA